MFSFTILLAALDPFLGEDAAMLRARSPTRCLASRVEVQPVQNRTTEHLDTAAFTTALGRGVAERGLAGGVAALKVDVHLSASEKRYVVLAALVDRASEQMT